MLLQEGTRSTWSYIVTLANRGRNWLFLLLGLLGSPRIGVISEIALRSLLLVLFKSLEMLVGGGARDIENGMVSFLALHALSSGFNSKFPISAFGLVGLFLLTRRCTVFLGLAPLLPLEVLVDLLLGLVLVARYGVAFVGRRLVEAAVDLVVAFALLSLVLEELEVLLVNRRLASL